MQVELQAPARERHLADADVELVGADDLPPLLADEQTRRRLRDPDLRGPPRGPVASTEERPAHEHGKDDERHRGQGERKSAPSPEATSRHDRDVRDELTSQLPGKLRVGAMGRGSGVAQGVQLIPHCSVLPSARR